MFTNDWESSSAQKPLFILYMFHCSERAIESQIGHLLIRESSELLVLKAHS